MNSTAVRADLLCRLKEGARGRMKRFLWWSCLFFWGCGAAFGGIAVRWATAWGVYDHTAGDLTGNDYFLLDSYSATWQLVYAGPNNSIDPPSLGNSVNGWVSGDDVVLAVRTIPLGGGTAPEDGTTWDSYLFFSSGSDPTYINMSWVTNGFVYQRLYEGPPGAGSWYLNSPLLALNPGWQEPQPPQDFWLDSFDQGVKPNQQFSAGNMGQTTLVLKSGMQHLIRYDYEFPAASRTLNALIGQQVPPGSQFIYMDVANQAYWPTITLDRQGSWGPRGTTTLARGVSYFLRIPPQGGLVASNQYSVTLAGYVPTTPATLTAAGNGFVSPLGYPYPTNKLFGQTALSAAAPANSMVFFWDPTNRYFTAGAKSLKGWMPAQANYTIQSGEGFFFKTPSGGAELNVVEPLP